MVSQLLGGLLIVVAIILGVVQHFSLRNFYGDAINKWYFWGLAIIISIIGIVLIAYYYMKK